VREVQSAAALAKGVKSGFHTFSVQHLRTRFFFAHPFAETQEAVEFIWGKEVPVDDGGSDVGQSGLLSAESLLDVGIHTAVNEASPLHEFDGVPVQVGIDGGAWRPEG
jgi:hypothetical protein